MAITFSGLASGLDTGSLIEKLVASERAQANTLATRQTNLNTQRSIVSSLSSAVAALGTAARGLDLDTELKPRSATVSDNRFTAAVSSGAAAAVHDVRVKQLAAAQITSSKTFATSGAGAAGAGGLSITVGGATKSIAWTASDSLEDIATRITNANAGVTASVLYDGTSYRLMVAAKSTGTAAAPTFVDSGSGLDLANTNNIKVAAANSITSIDGVDITRPTNVVSDALTGVTLTLSSVHATADTSAKLSVGLDTKTLTDRVKAVVSAYNAVNSALHVQLDYTGTAKGQNTLFGDQTLRQLQQQLGTLASNAYGTSNLGALGIARDKTGAMTFDEAKFTAAIAANPDAASDLFVTNGFATAIGKLADQYTQAGTGIFATKTAALTARHKVLQTQIDRINQSADSMQKRLESQFGSLEQAMSNLRSQSSFLSSILG